MRHPFHITCLSAVIASITVILSRYVSKYTIIHDCTLTNLIGSYKDIAHTTIFTNSRKRTSGFTGVYIDLFISFVHYFGIIIKGKCSSFNQGIIHQPIMSINKVITHMTELSDPPSYIPENYHEYAFCMYRESNPKTGKLNF